MADDRNDEKWLDEVGPIEDERPTVLKGNGPTATVEWHPAPWQAKEAVEAAKRSRDVNPDAEER